MDKLQWVRQRFKVPPPLGCRSIVTPHTVVTTTHYLQLLGKGPVIRHDYGLSTEDLREAHRLVYGDFIPGPHRMNMVHVGSRLPELVLKGSPVVKPFLAKILCQHQVRIRFDMRSPSLTHAHLGSKLESRIVLWRTFLGGTFSGDAKVNAVTAVYLVNRVFNEREMVVVGTELLKIVGDTISHDIRCVGLGSFIGGVCLTDTVQDMTLEAATRQYDLDLSTLRTCHNLLTAYLKITHHPRSKSVGIPLHLQLEELVRLISNLEETRRARTCDIDLDRNVGECDIRLLAMRTALAYGALVGLLNDIIAETTKRNADREAALAAFTAMASAGTGAGAAMGGPVAEKLVVASVDGIATSMTSKLSARHQRQNAALNRIFSSIVDKFNVEVLARADRGVIENLNPLSLPSDPDILPLVTPSSTGHNVLRPTRHDIQLFKTTAINVFLSVCSQEGVTLSKESSQPTAAQSTTLERLSEALGSPLSDTPKPDSPPTDLNATALRAEIARHYPPDEREDWYTVIECCARETAMCSFYPTLENGLQWGVWLSWRRIIAGFLQSSEAGMICGRHIADGRYANWQRGVTTFHRLVNTVTARDPSATLATLFDQIAYFFLEPRCVIYMKAYGIPFIYDDILWNAQTIRK